jgi:hypothetical protein
MVEKSEGNSTLGKPKRRQEHNIKIDFKEMGLDCVGFVWLKDLVDTVFSLLISKFTGKF